MRPAEFRGKRVWQLSVDGILRTEIPMKQGMALGWMFTKAF